MRNSFHAWILISLFFLSLIGCEPERLPEPVRISGEAQGTYYSIIYYDGQQRDFHTQIDSLLKAFDQSVSLWVPGSILNRINEDDAQVVPDRFFRDNFMISQQVAAETDGAFDITVGPLVRAWGFGSNGIRHEDAHIIDSLVGLVGYQRVYLDGDQIVKEDPRIWFDFNAVAQGYSVDVLANYLSSKGIENYLVDIGGEVRGHGQKPEGSRWRVGVEKPAGHKEDGRTLSAVIELENTSIATSGNYRKYFEENGIRYSHTIDPKTGYPARHTLLSATIVCDSTAYADAYATACMVMGLERSMDFVNAHPDLEGFFIYSTPEGFASIATDGFNKRLVQNFDE